MTTTNSRQGPAGLPGPAGKTIVFCCNSLWGLVNFRGRVIQALVQDGHRVVLVANEDVPLAQVAALGAEFVQWDVAPRGTNLWREVGVMRSLTRIYKRIGPHIAFQFTIKPVMYGGIVAAVTGVRCISVITGLGYLFLADNWKSKLGKALYRLTLNRSREVWFLNGDDRAFFDRARLTGRLPVRTLPGEGIDLGHFARAPLPPSDGRFVFLMIARLVKDKGVLEFAAAARRVRQQHPQAVFQLLGPSYSANAMSVPMETVDAWAKEGIVEYLGSTDDVRTAIAAAHCVVLPSYREGMPRTLMEAAAMGRPAIATDVTGCRDVVVAGRTGLLCRPQDADSLAEACMDLLGHDRARLEAMADEAYALAREQFDDRIVIGIYRDTVAAVAA
jgi:glycosyltransferase involved in cell wall biosynthesis